MTRIIHFGPESQAMTLAEIARLAAQQRSPSDLAHDVLPEVAFAGLPGGEKGDEEPMMGISYPNIVAVLVEAIKELVGRVQTLEAEPR